MISGEEISIDSAMVEDINSRDQPNNTEGGCKFLRHVGYYRNLVRDFSYITTHLKNLVKKGFYFN